MKRITVIGTIGSGKSTFASALSECLDYPHVETDPILWNPGWQKTPDSEFHLKLSQAISGDRWILDGTYNQIYTIKWERVDTVFLLDLGFFPIFSQLLKRTLSRIFTRQELWPGTGNKETFYKSFMSKESILLLFLMSYRRNRLKYEKLLTSKEHDHIKIYRLKSRKEVKTFLSNV